MHKTYQKKKKKNERNLYAKITKNYLQKRFQNQWS